jgi:hypothetical protein
LAEADEGDRRNTHGSGARKPFAERKSRRVSSGDDAHVYSLLASYMSSCCASSTARWTLLIVWLTGQAQRRERARS